MICAAGEHNEIGKQGHMCFNIPGDLKFFKKVTFGHPVFMGLSTFLSLPKMLPGRKHYVAVFEHTELPEGVEEVFDIFDFAEKWRESDEELFVIGGGSIYRQMLPCCDRIYLTEVEASDSEAEVFFPTFDRSRWNREYLGENEDGGIHYVHYLYTRKTPEKTQAESEEMS